MSLILVGLNHRTAPVELREKFSLAGCGVPMALEELKKYTAAGDGRADAPLREGAVLSTCNRFEVYAVGAGEPNGFGTVEEYLYRLQGVPFDDLRDHFYHMEERDAVGHLMKVAAGVDSMVVGEPQVLGQVNEAFREAQMARTVGLHLGQVFSRAIRVGKRARTETAIGRYTTSVSHAAVELAEREFGDLSRCRAAIIGAGDMASLAASSLKEHSVGDIAVINRTHSRSIELAAQVGGRPLGWDQLVDALVWADVVITATDAPHTLIYAEDIRKILPARKGRKLLFVDIALPRDVEPEVGRLDNVEVHDIDELQTVVTAGLELRMAAVPDVERIVDEEVRSYYDWVKSRDVVPVIVDFREAIRRIVSLEVDDALRQFEDPKDREIVERLRHRVVNKILHEPSSRLKTLAANGNGILYADAIRELFALDEPPRPL
jgi:glutamyl-tRNA reductase